MAETKRSTSDPTVTSRQAKSETESGQPHPARRIDKADDYAGDRKYRDVPDAEKPAPETVAQYEVRPGAEAA